MSLQNYLHTLSVESGLVEGDEGDVSEITVVTPETVTELESEVEDLAGKIKESNAELDQVLEASDAVISTEAALAKRVQVLRNPAFAASYNRTSQALLMGGAEEAMEAYKMPSALYSNLAETSFEADEAGGGVGQAEKDAVKTEGWMKKFMTILANAAKAAKALFIRFLDLFRTSGEKNARSVAILEKAISEREGTAKDGKMKGSSFSDLTVNGQVNPAAALQLVNDGYTKHLSDAQTKVNGVVTKVADILKRGSSSGFKGVIDSLLKASGARGDDSHSAALVLGAFINEFPSDFKYPLPGGREASYSVTKKSTGAPTVSFSISKASGEAPAEIDVPSLGDLSKLVSELKANAKVIGDATTAIDASIKSSESLLTTAEEMAKKPGASKEDQAPLQAVVGAAQSVLTISKMFLPKFNDHALKTAHAAYQYGLTAVSKYPKKGAAKAA